MKITLYAAYQVMVCLMLLSTNLPAGASTTVEARFNLHAKYKDVTCNQTLSAHGDVNGTTIDFGTFSSDSVEKTKSVVLTLDCSNGTGLPDTVKVSFSVTGSATVDSDMHNRLYPSYLSKNAGESQMNLYYDWVWGDSINSAIKQSVSSTAGHATLRPDANVNLSNDSMMSVYEVSSECSMTNVLDFPMKITMGAIDSNNLAAGNYIADVTVTVSYD